jgi:hypothetical protein
MFEGNRQFFDNFYKKSRAIPAPFSVALDASRPVAAERDD